MLIIVLVVFAIAGFTTIVSSTWQAAALWLVGFVVAIVLLPVTAVERWLHGRRP